MIFYIILFLITKKENFSDSDSESESELKKAIDINSKIIQDVFVSKNEIKVFKNLLCNFGIVEKCGAIIELVTIFFNDFCSTPYIFTFLKNGDFDTCFCKHHRSG